MKNKRYLNKKKRMKNWKIYEDDFYSKNGFVLMMNEFKNVWGLPKDIGIMIDEYINDNAIKAWNLCVKFTINIFKDILIEEINEIELINFHKKTYKMFYDNIGLGSNISNIIKNMCNFNNINKINNINDRNYEKIVSLSSFYDDKINFDFDDVRSTSTTTNEVGTLIKNLIYDTCKCITKIYNSRIIGDCIDCNSQLLINYIENILISSGTGLFLVHKPKYKNYEKYSLSYLCHKRFAIPVTSENYASKNIKYNHKFTYLNNRNDYILKLVSNQLLINK